MSMLRPSVERPLLGHSCDFLSFDVALVVLPNLPKSFRDAEIVAQASISYLPTSSMDHARTTRVEDLDL